MGLSTSHPHPLGLENPVVLRAAAILLAAPNWDAAPTVTACAGAWWMRPYFEYTRGGGSGAMQYYYDVSPYGVAPAGGENEWFHGSLYVPAPMILCADQESHVQREYIEYCATGAELETFVGPPIHLAGCIERIRLFCRESGNLNLPGTARALAVFYREG